MTVPLSVGCGAGGDVQGLAGCPDINGSHGSMGRSLISSVTRASESSFNVRWTDPCSWPLQEAMEDHRQMRFHHHGQRQIVVHGVADGDDAVELLPEHQRSGRYGVQAGEM